MYICICMWGYIPVGHTPLSIVAIGEGACTCPLRHVRAHTYIHTGPMHWQVSWLDQLPTWLSDCFSVYGAFNGYSLQCLSVCYGFKVSIGWTQIGTHCVDVYNYGIYVCIWHVKTCLPLRGLKKQFALLDIFTVRSADMKLEPQWIDILDKFQTQHKLYALSDNLTSDVNGIMSKICSAWKFLSILLGWIKSKHNLEIFDTTQNYGSHGIALIIFKVASVSSSSFCP